MLLNLLFFVFDILSGKNAIFISKMFHITQISAQVNFLVIVNLGIVSFVSKQKQLFPFKCIKIKAKRGLTNFR